MGERERHAGPASETAAAPESARPATASPLFAAGNAAVTRLLAPTAVEVEFSQWAPWIVSMAGPYTPEAVAAALYGSELMPLAPGEGGFQVTPRLLVEPYRSQYAQAMAARRAELDAEVAADAREISDKAELAATFPALQQSVIDKFERWANETFPNPPGTGDGRSRYLDKLIVALRRDTRDIGGVLTTDITSVYDLILNRFSRAGELRALRDRHSTYAGAEPQPEHEFFGMGGEDFFGMLWEDTKSGEVASRIGNYGKGVVEAGVGAVEGAAKAVAHPVETFKAIGELPHTVATLWRKKGKLWNEFVRASPDEQAHIIGRLFGEAEVLIATAGAGGGTPAAGAAPQLAEAVQVVGGGTAALTGGGALTVDLGRLGEAARLTMMMAQAGDKAKAGEAKAAELEDTGIVEDHSVTPESPYSTTPRLAKGLAGEKMAADVLGARGHKFFGYKPDISGTNQGGIDLVTLAPDGVVWLVDNKALEGTRNVSKVSALVKNFEQNVAAVEAELVRMLADKSRPAEQLEVIEKALNAVRAKNYRKVVTNANLVAKEGVPAGVTEALDKAGIGFEDLMGVTKKAD